MPMNMAARSISNACKPRPLGRRCAMNDLAFAEQLRDLMGLDPNVPLDFVSDPSKRQGYYPGWLYRAMLPSEKKAVVQAYCGGESASSIAKRLKRGRSTIVNLLKGVGIYLSLLEKDEKKIEEWRTRFSEFIATREIDKRYAEWLVAWRKRQRRGAIAQEEEASL
jgi:hypothetical protein